MPEWGDELAERIQRFTEETGLTEEQLIKAADDSPPYHKDFVLDLAADGITPEQHREVTLVANMATLVTDESIAAIKTLKDDVGFSTDEVAEILVKTLDEGSDLLALITSNPALRDLQLLTQVADVPASEIMELFKGQDSEGKYSEIAYGSLDDLVSENFPDSDWDKHEDVDTHKLSYDDPVIREIVGEPKSRGFTEQLVEREDHDVGKDDDKHR